MSWVGRNPTLEEEMTSSLIKKKEALKESISIEIELKRRLIEMEDAKARYAKPLSTPTSKPISLPTRKTVREFRISHSCGRVILITRVENIETKFPDGRVDKRQEVTVLDLNGEPYDFNHNFCEICGLEIEAMRPTEDELTVDYVNMYSVGGLAGYSLR